MKKDGLFADILNAVVQHERQKVKTGKPNYFVDQKKQLWYGLMNSIDGDTESAPSEGENGDADEK